MGFLFALGLLIVVHLSTRTPFRYLSKEEKVHRVVKILVWFILLLMLFGGHN